MLGGGVGDTIVDGGAPAYPPYMAQVGGRLIDLGYRIIPIIPGAKVPGQYRRGEWCNYHDWSKHCTRDTTTFETGVWSKWPGCAVGIACGNVVAVDIDILDADIAHAVQARALAELGPTPAIRVGKAPKRLLVYRCAKPIKPIKRHPIEVLGVGNQFVAFAIHPDTGQPYQWIDEPLDDMPLTSLPAVTEEGLRAFLDGVSSLIPDCHKVSRLGPDRSGDYYYAHGGELGGTLEAVSAALAYIPNDDLPYDDWIRIGLALKGALGEAGYSLWRDWSAQSGKDVPKATDKAWAGFRPSRIGAGSIYYYAQQNGWFPGSSLILSASVAAAVGSVDVSGFAHADTVPSEPVNVHAESTPEIGVVAAVQEREPVFVDAPAFITAAPGLLGELTRWITSTATIPQPALALGAALTFLGSLAGQRWKLDRPDTRSNIYVVALAGSGSGKEHPRSMIKMLCAEAGLKDFISEDVASSSGMFAQLYRHNCRVYLIDELGHFISGVFGKNTAHYRADIMTKLTTLWSSAHTYLQGQERSELREESGKRQDIDQPCVCVYGSTVPERFWEAIASGAISDGSMARWLVMPVAEDYPERNRAPADPRAGMPSVPVLRFLTGVAEPDTFAVAAALAAVQQPPGTRGPKGELIPAKKATPQPQVVPSTDDADAYNDRLADDGHALKREHAGKPTAAVAARWHEHIRRVALVAAVADNPVFPVLTVAHLMWARELVDWCVCRMLAGVREYVADSPFEAATKRVLRAIDANPGITKSELTRRMQSIDRRTYQDALAHLIEADMVSIEKVSSVTKPTVRFRVKK